MSYQVLARKWRPKNFTQVVGQGHVLRVLVNGLNQGRVHHAYLFTGTRGVGKTTLARIIAKCLNCETGISSQPCGQCDACREIDEGRFVDLIEVDAASRTKVEDTRELLENVQYAPTRGRHKVYLIDEVHMLSGHSFNALLKTLEEPPPHVKFLLATTDPQRLPVTVLSRCLQFNLKCIPVQTISAQLRYIVEKELVEADKTALNLLAKAADGSMRDALSLLDQAIAFGKGQVAEAAVNDMLGSIPKTHFSALVLALAANDITAVMECVAGLAEQSADFHGVLVELLSLFHQVALYQSVPQAVDQETMDTELISKLAAAMSPEDLQLFYQIALMGRRDLPLVPDPKAGFEMILLRMLSFKPLKASALTGKEPVSVPSETVPPRSDSKPKPRQPKARAQPSTKQPSTVRKGPATASVTGPAESDLDWPSVLRQLGLRGVAYALASNLSLKSRRPGEICLVLEAQHAQIRTKNAEARLQQALASYFSEDLRLRIDVESHAAETPAQRQNRSQAEKQQVAEQSIENDYLIQGLKERFGAKIVPGSVRPVTDTED
ncbi:MAG: DNA polymerase III subunit gamma/tau [Gammaproteobacteria bacterium]|nr:DNA polymerase III subunit gamma/tau [Gammaproteobacteria bacterium]